MTKFLVAGIALALAMPLPAQVAAPNPYSDRLAKLPDLQRRAALRRAVLDNGQRCKRVEVATRKGNWKNLVMWTAKCVPGGDYGIFVGADGSVQVRPCADLRTLKLPPC